MRLVWSFFFSPLSSDKVKEPCQPLFLCFNRNSYGMAVIRSICLPGSSMSGRRAQGSLLPDDEWLRLFQSAPDDSLASPSRRKVHFRGSSPPDDTPEPGCLRASGNAANAPSRAFEPGPGCAQKSSPTQDYVPGTALNPGVDPAQAYEPLGAQPRHGHEARNG